MSLHYHHNVALVVLSVVIAIFASYTALDLVNSISTSRGKSKFIWLFGGSLAMGVGIWSMHFIGMLAFRLPGIEIFYDVYLLILSIVVAIIASAMALYLVSTKKPGTLIYVSGSLLMGAAIAGMHYIGIASMRLSAEIHWNYTYVALSILIAVTSSFVALFVCYKVRDDLSVRGFIYRGIGGTALGFAIAGMHYTAMAAMEFTASESIRISQNDLLATDGLASAIIIGTLVILGIALSGSNVDRALSRKTLLNEMLQESIKARDEFVSVASHELRTPMTSIKLSIEVAMKLIEKDDEQSKQKATHNLVKANRNIDRLNLLVEDMLDISRLSAGKMKLQKEGFNLSEMVAEVVDRFGPMLEDAGCKVTFQNAGVINGHWDRFRLEQVIVNLLSNAAKYAAGTLVEIKVWSEKNSAKISVRDHGKGITDADQERIFRRFERVQEKDNTKGLGLGLYIVSEIVTLHHGDIKVNSKINEGAEFLVTLPVT